MGEPRCRLTDAVQSTHAALYKHVLKLRLATAHWHVTEANHHSEHIGAEVLLEISMDSESYANSPLPDSAVPT